MRMKAIFLLLAATAFAQQPAWVARTAETLARALAVEPEELAAATTKNFKRLFHL